MHNKKVQPAHVRLLWTLIALLMPFAVAHSVLGQPTNVQRSVPVLTISGAIGPASADYVTQGIADAAEQGAPMVLIQMDTPGGLDTSMREIIRSIVNSPVPVATYVSPIGARAASAGAFILMGSHVAAMAPGTNVGAATPVQIGGSNPFAPPEEKDKQDPDNKAPPKQASASDAKALNDAIAYIRSLAEMRGRNADWAESAVREAASLSAQDALRQNVADIVARDSDDLLKQISGRTVNVAGRDVRLVTTNMALAPVEPNWRSRFLDVITNPNIALILMMIGIYGLLFEFMNPGALYPGTIGGICLLLGLYALTALPVNYAAIALMLLGLALMAGEAFSPSFGILGIGGIIAFVLGATILFDTDLPQYQIGLPVLGAIAVASLGATVLTVRLATTARKRKIVSGREELIGATATILDWAERAGHVQLHSERWNAQGAGNFANGQQVRVTGIDHLVVSIEALPKPED